MESDYWLGKVTNELAHEVNSIFIWEVWIGNIKCVENIIALIECIEVVWIFNSFSFKLRNKSSGNWDCATSDCSIVVAKWDIFRGVVTALSSFQSASWIELRCLCWNCHCCHILLAKRCSFVVRTKKWQLVLVINFSFLFVLIKAGK